MDQHQKIALDEANLTPEFLNAEEEALFAEFMLGEEAIRFLNSDLGRVMRGFALMRVAEASGTWNLALQALDGRSFFAFGEGMALAHAHNRRVSRCCAVSTRHGETQTLFPHSPPSALEARRRKPGCIQTSL